MALRLHQDRQLPQAETIYRQILAADPRHAATLHMLGVLVCGVGRNDLGADFIRRSIAVAAKDPAAHYNLGAALAAQGKWEEAIAPYRQAIKLNPNFPEAQNNLGVVLKETGRFDQSADACRRAIKLRPEFAAAHNNLGNALHALGRVDDAVAAYRRALELQPNLAEAHRHLGCALRDQGRIDEAIASWRAALTLAPQYATPHDDLGRLFVEQDRLDDALAEFRRAAELQPGSARAQNAVGGALLMQGRLDEAATVLRGALERDPKLVAAHNNLSHVFFEQGRLDDALAACRRALEIEPDSADARWNQALPLLLHGDFAAGWPLFEARWEALGYPPRPFTKRRWDGRPFAGKRILVHAEQGLGDSIQFIRYAPLIAERGGHVVVECQAPLVELFRSVKGVAEIVPAGAPLPAFDTHVPMPSLPLVFQTTLETIPNPPQYLTADPARCEAWKARLGGDGSRLKVGLVWAGNPQHRRDRTRSIPLSQWRPILEVEGVDFFSLQKDRGAEEIESLRITDCASSLETFSDTAALVASLDLVICVDTAVLHLAGALGKPVWALVSMVPDWRWLLERPDSPWYPSLRLFRQTQPLDWAPAIDAVRRELDALLGAPLANSPISSLGR